MIIAGVLVGAGTRLGNGCTSGHGFAGLARLSRRSIVAVLVFMVTAFVTVYIQRHVMEAKIMTKLIAFISGLLFSAGLIIGGMSNPQRSWHFRYSWGGIRHLLFIMGRVLSSVLVTKLHVIVNKVY